MGWVEARIFECRIIAARSMTSVMQGKVTGLAPGWTFNFSEESPGHVVAEGWRSSGHTVRRTASDEMELAWEIGHDALSINDQLPEVEASLRREYLVCSTVARLLPPKLKGLLTEEILLGNTISESWAGWGRVVRHASRFRLSRKDVRPPLLYSLLNDPHYWYEEVSIEGTDFSIAAG